MNPPCIEDILADALAWPREKRGRRLAEACRGDEKLRAEVESLLEAHERAGPFMAEPSVEIAPTASAGEKPGTIIGRYKLLQLIGEGGFGAVYMAEQREPVQRRVAVKIIKLGMDTKQVIARFEAERQALAMMDHPSIAKVLDAGATESGRPYFVMELVRGRPFTTFCDEQKLSIRSRLELFSQVCSAVQHAHQKGIIHRDLKPSNILVSEIDGRPSPRIIDFGIAKAMGGAGRILTEKTLFTDFHHFIGTPEYMSPEQAGLGAVDIDTRSDIYSLGVLLYELVTSTPPFEPRSLRSAAWEEMRRIIREEEPPPPSTRLHTLENSGNVAAQRQVEPAQLISMVRGDLDWIVMKCLEKDRARRFDSANALAIDLRRHLEGDPVLAAPPSRAYRLRKFIKRHRIGVMAGLIVAAALILGIMGTTTGLIWALAAEAKAEQRADRLTELLAFQDSQLADLDAVLFRTSSPQGRKHAIPYLREIVRERERLLGPNDSCTLSSMLFLGVQLGNAGEHAEAEELLCRAVTRARAMTAPDDALMAALLCEYGVALRKLGRLGEAHTHGEEAVRLARQTSATFDDCVFPIWIIQCRYARTLRELGLFEEAEGMLLDAYRLRCAALGEDARPGTPTAALAGLYRDWHEAEPGCGYDLIAQMWAKAMGSRGTDQVSASDPAD